MTHENFTEQLEAIARRNPEFVKLFDPIARTFKCSVCGSVDDNAWADLVREDLVCAPCSYKGDRQFRGYLLVYNWYEFGGADGRTPKWLA